ncbi:MAG: hypothetical protein ABSG25_00870 [Bryobacteraceae bacterium]
MNPAFVVRFRPNGPWRIGPDTGARNRVDRIYHSDSLFSAVTHAMARLGQLDQWLADTAANPDGPAVRFSSCFPFLKKTQFVVPPQSLWPPPPSAKVRWRNASFVPLAVVRALVAEQPLDENAWAIDGASGCLIPSDSSSRSGPFRTSVRTRAAVDRLSGPGLEVHGTACLEFAPGAGLWAVVSFADEAARSAWSDAVQAALRLLADSGFGGERSLGWGGSEAPEFTAGVLPDLILPPNGASAPVETGDGTVAEALPKPAPETGWWLLSLYSPAAADAIDWQRGSYALRTRGGRVESPHASGDSKKALRMVEEGSVLVCGAPLRGAAPDVAPDGFPHPVYRAGFPVAVPVPLRSAAAAPAAGASA